MKKVFVMAIVLAIVCFFRAGLVSAQPAKIAIIDLDKFQKTSKSFQKAGAVFKKKLEDLQKKLDDERTAVAKLEEEFKKQSMMLSLDAQEDKRRELEKKRRYYKYLYDEFSQEMKETESDSIKKVMEELQKVVAKIGQKEGYTLIVEKRTPGLIYFNKATDITDQVIEAYDKSTH
jgi:outer membrane protein